MHLLPSNIVKNPSISFLSQLTIFFAIYVKEVHNMMSWGGTISFFFFFLNFNKLNYASIDAIYEYDKRGT